MTEDSFFDALKKMKVEVKEDGLVVTKHDPCRMKRFKRPDLLLNFLYCGNYLCPRFALCRTDDDKALDEQKIGRGFCAGFYFSLDEMYKDAKHCRMMTEVMEEDIAYLEEFDRQLFKGMVFNGEAI